MRHPPIHSHVVGVTEASLVCLKLTLGLFHYLRSLDP